MLMYKRRKKKLTLTLVAKEARAFLGANNQLFLLDL